MKTKILTIAAAVAVCLSWGTAYAQTDPTAPPAAATDPAAPPPATDAAAPPGAPVDPTATPGAPTDPALASDPALAVPAAPAVVPPAEAPAAPAAEGENPYGLMSLWAQSDFFAKGILIVLAIMSVGTWYIFFMKYWEQSRVINQAKAVERRFWSASTLEEGIDRLGKNNVFRNIAERGQQAMTRQSGVSAGLTQADWVAMSLQRAMEDENGRLAGGIAFLASVGSTAPFVGLLGTVWGIYHALIAIGASGQASIDKVAGPVGEALIMTAIGLGVAIPAVLCYNLLVRRNKVINEKLRAFANDLQTFLLAKR
jgi:biopolymer transport protein ExbB